MLGEITRGEKTVIIGAGAKCEVVSPVLLFFFKGGGGRGESRGTNKSSDSGGQVQLSDL